MQTVLRVSILVALILFRSVAAFCADGSDKLTRVRIGLAARSTTSMPFFVARERGFFHDRRRCRTGGQLISGTRFRTKSNTLPPTMEGGTMSRNGPPPMEMFLGLDRKVADPLYDRSPAMDTKDLVDLHRKTGIGPLSGARGCWHRLWSALVIKHSMPGGDAEETIEAIHAEFAAVFGRRLTADELAALEANAKHHAETVMKAILDEYRKPKS